jgi:ABC-type multidrug transport system fused ATPase/permease subunit
MGDINCAFNTLIQGCYVLAISFHNIRTFNKGLQSVGEIMHIINRKPAIVLDDPSSNDFEVLENDIKFENVSFCYPGRNEIVLNNVTFTIEKGKTTAIVGPSGSGKSTIVKLLERFYDPQAGIVRLNGEDIKKSNLRQFRQRVGYVGQEPCLLNESVKDNMLNANPNATDEDIETALKTIGASEFVKNLPNGVDTRVGPAGNKLSGGQKQRLAIARAIIKNPDLLIFDEATSALDSENEKKVQEAIEEVLKMDMTKVVIAHRLSTIKNADKIILVQDGVIEGEGTHDEMMISNELYATLVNIQEAAETVVMRSEM